MAHLQHPLRSKSSSSAIDFQSTGTTTSLSTLPSSSSHSKHHGPSLSTHSSPDAYGMENPRKRNTWGRVVDAGQDPLRLDSGSSSLSPSAPASRGNRHGTSASPPPPLPLGMTSGNSTAGWCAPRSQVAGESCPPSFVPKHRTYTPSTAAPTD